MTLWKPWTVEIVGRESGTTRPLPFVRFWTQRRADLWCIVMNMENRSVHRNFSDPESVETWKTLTFFRSRRM